MIHNSTKCKMASAITTQEFLSTVFFSSANLRGCYNLGCLVVSPRLTPSNKLIGRGAFSGYIYTCSFYPPTTNL